MKAFWNNQVIAESNETISMENEEYFPPDSVKKIFLRESLTQTTCPRKGVAYYYSVVADGKENIDAAVFYPDPKPAANQIKNYVAFSNGIEISK